MMNCPELTGHAGWFADVRRILDITEVTPGLPLPRICGERASFFFVGAAHAEQAREGVKDARTVLEYAFGVAFVPRITKYGSARHYILTAVLPSGLMVDLVALAEHFDAADEHEDTREPVAA